MPMPLPPPPHCPPPDLVRESFTMVRWLKLENLAEEVVSNQDFALPAIVAALSQNQVAHALRHIQGSRVTSGYKLATVGEREKTKQKLRRPLKNGSFLAYFYR